eukprot:COSAG06_NODE_2162_length_7444_cov_81.420150_11_plen_60_part_01
MVVQVSSLRQTKGSNQSSPEFRQSGNVSSRYSSHAGARMKTETERRRSFRTVPRILWRDS